MKALFKKITNITLALGACACLIGGGAFAFSQMTQAKADTSLEMEFTNNNQFSVTAYPGVAYEYVDGASVGLLAGYDGAVLKIDGTSGTAYVNVDFSGAQIKAESVESIVVKVYSPNYNAGDSFRVTQTGNGSEIYDEHKVDMSAWTEITLTKEGIAKFTQEGYLTSANFGVRARTYQTYYIDSIIVNVKVDLEADFTNNGQFALSQYSGLAYEVVDGATESGLPAGYEGTVLKITGQKYSFVGVDFSAKQIKASDVESIVVRGYSPDYTSADEFRTIDTGLVKYVQYGPGAYDMSTWCDVSLNASSIAQMTDGNGYLSSIYLGLCDKGTVSAYFYIDSITVKMKEVELVYGEPTFEETSNAYVGAWGWNHKTDNAAVIKDANYGYTIIGSWAMTSNAENLAATKNVTSLSIKLNGETFYDLYQTDDGYRLNSQLGYFGFSMPTAGLVAGNGYEYPTIEIVKGTPFYDGNYLPETTIIYKDGAWQLKPEEELAETAVFVGPWANADAYNASDRVLLQYSGDTAWEHTNKGDLASKITYKNSKTNTTYTVTESDIAGWEGKKWIILTGLSGYDTIEIVGGGKFGGDILIPELTLYNVNGRWVTTALEEVTTNFMQIADGWNNKIESSESRNILSYDVKPLGDATDATNLAATLNRTSLMVKYNGKTFCDLYADTENENHKQYNISYAHGSRYFYFTIPEADLVDGAIFEVEAGTPFMNNYLGGVKFQFSASANAWIPYVELVYGEPTFEETSNAYVGAWGWNHKTDNAAVIKDANYGYTIMGNWGITQNAENLAATPNTTSYSITLNGKSFYELYQQDDGYRLNAQISYFGFSVPTAALVAGNGYEYPTIEIANGTPFYDGNYLPETIIIYKDGAWQLKPEEVVDTTNYNPDFVSINSVFNNDSNGFLVVQFDTTGWAQGAIPTSYSGITYNGNDISDLVASSGGVKFFQEHSLWFTYSSTAGAKLVAGYNGYSHPTIKIAEGATVVYEEKTYTFHELVLYLVEDKWTTEQPDGYAVSGPEIPELGTPDAVFKGFGMWNNENGITLFEFTNFVNKPTTTVSYIQTTGHYIRLNGKRLSEISGTNIYTWDNMYWLRIDIPNPVEGSILTIEEGTPFAGNYLPKLVFKFADGIWCKAFTVNMEIDGETYTVYSQDDVPVIIDDTYFEELLAERSVPGKVVSFSTRGVTYKAGTKFKVLTDTNLSVQVIGFNTEEGASVRLNTPTGIRFETHIDKADYDNLIALYGEGNIETGTYIVPKSLLAGVDFRSYFADGTKIDKTDYVKVVNFGFANKETAETDGYYQYYGSLVNIQPTNYCTDFFGIGYIKIIDGDNVYTVFGGYDLDEHTRSIYYVSSRAYKDYANGTTQQKALKSYLDSVLYITDNVTVSNIIDVDGYVSPYSVKYDAQTGVYTVTGNAELKSVMIGDKKRINSRTSTLEINGEQYYITDYNLASSANYSTLTFKVSTVLDPQALVDFALEVPSNRGVKILQITDTELMDATQMRTTESLSTALQEEYARKNIYANCFNYIAELVELNRPDLIILTGDLVNGSFDDNGTMWLKFIEFMDSFNIPWAPTFGALENESAKGAVWQREQLVLAQNCLFKDGTATGNGDYTIGITDNGVIRRVIYLLDSNSGNGINSTQVNWIKATAANIDQYYGAIPAFAFYNKNSAVDFASDFASANIDGIFMGNSPDDNSTILSNGIYYTYGTKTGSYGEHNENKVGGTYVEVSANGLEFAIFAECLNKMEMKNKESIHLVETYDGSSIVTDAYLAPIWETNRIYDETGLFVGETGSVTLMYTPTDPKEVVVRDITLGVTYTYGVDYTVSGNKVTRVAGGNLPYMSYDEYYRVKPVTYNGVEQAWRITTVEDEYRYSGTRYMYYDEGYGGASHHVTFTYNKSESWMGTKITGDAKAQSFIEKLKTEKEAKIMFYGDSITVGCNASGTPYGSYRNPFLPAWDDLVTNSLEKLYGANITKYNAAVGGWTTAQGAENINTKFSEVGASFAEIDLFVIAFGMNDPATSEADYVASIKQMINAYYAANPTGSVLLVSPMQPNTQSEMVAGNQDQWENALNGIKNSAEYNGKNISLAKVFTVFSELISVSGKLSRDYLGNNINHPNDFGVRIYAQVILRTLCGDDFS